MKVRLGVDLGGTSAKVAVVNSSRKIIREISIPTAGFPRPIQMVDKIAKETLSLLRNDQAVSLGIGVAGDIDSQQGMVRISPNLGWKNVPLKKYFHKYFKCLIKVDNDANAAAWGIYQTQTPDSVKNVIVMTLGTGVGGGIVINGQLFQGATGSAGEIGHLNIEMKGPLCNCGNRGCLETYVGGPHLIKKVRKLLSQGKKSSLRHLSQDLTPHAIAQAANRGDALALSIWEGVGEALGVAIGDLVYLLNPERIVFTGGIAQAGNLILKPLWNKLNERSFKTPLRAVKIQIAKEASHIGVLGAALL